MSKHLFLDTETTGLRPGLHDIIQLAAILEVDGKVVGEFSEYLAPMNPASISSKALEVNGITKEQLETFPPAKDILNKFIKFLAPYVPKSSNDDRFIIAGQNPNFDKGFLEALFTRNGYKIEGFNKLFSYQVIDLLSLNVLLRNKGYIPLDSNIKLATMADYYGVVVEKHHDAYEDVKATYTIFKKIMDIFIKSPHEINIDMFDKNSPIYLHFKKLKHYQATSN